MCQRKCDIIKPIAYIVIAAILILFGCMTYHEFNNCGTYVTTCSAKKDTVMIVKDTSATSSIMAVDSAKTEKFLVEYTMYKNKVDSLSNVVSNVNGQYISMIDMMIDKFNTWVGFWLAVLSLILVLVSVWQYLKIEKYEERIKSIESKNEKISIIVAKESEKLTKHCADQKEQLSDGLTDIKTKIHQFQKQAKDYLDCQIAEHKYSTLENRMTSLLLCLSSVPDPQMFSDSDERKEQISYYLGLTSNLLAEYFKLIEQEHERHQLRKANISCIPMVLLNLRMSIIRLQGVLHDPIIYIKYEELKGKIETLETSIRRDPLFGQDNLADLNTLIKQFNEFKSEIDRCKEIV